MTSQFFKNMSHILDSKFGESFVREKYVFCGLSQWRAVKNWAQLQKKKCSNITVAMIRVFQQRTYIFLRFRWLHIDKNLAANYQGLSLITYSKKNVFLKKANSLLATKLYIQPKNRRYCITAYITWELTSICKSYTTYLILLLSF